MSQIYATGPTIDGGEYHTCIIDSLGVAKCWGRDSEGQSTPPQDVGRVTSISSGGFHTCAITELGLATCWGANWSGQASVPGDLGKVTQISTGNDNSCAVTEAGEVRCWGRADLGINVPPSGLGNVAQLSEGANHVCALSDLGVVKCWGLAGPGAINVPADLAPVIQISSGGAHTCALSENGSVRCWGYSDYGITAVPSNLGRVTQVSAGDFHTCVLTNQGLVKCWGYNPDGAVGVPANLSGAIQISSGGWHSCAVLNTGSTRCWGRSYETQTTVPSSIGQPLGVAELSLRSTPKIMRLSSSSARISVDAGQWDAGVSFGYMWLIDGLDTGITTETYSVTPSDYLHQISVKLFASKLGYKQVVKASNAITIDSVSFDRSPGTPSIYSFDGVLVGQANPQINGMSLNFQWYRDGEILQGKIGEELALGNDDLGHSFQIGVTYSKTGYASISNLSESFVPAQLPPRPVITKVIPIDTFGNLRIIFDPGPYLGNGSYPTSFQWSIDGGLTWVSESNGIMPTLAKPNNYLDAHIGLPNSQVSLTMRSMNTGGWSPLSVPFITPTSISTAISKPQITGSNKVGGTLSAIFDSIDPSDSIVSYTWLRDGITISRANQSQYLLTPEDFMHLISVRVTGDRENYLSGGQLSDGIRIEAGTIEANSKPTVRGDSALGSTLFVDTDIHADRVSYLWLRNGLSTGISSESYKTDLQDMGSKISVQVTYSNFGYFDFAIRSDEISIPTTVSNTPCSSSVDRSAWLSSPGAQPGVSGSSAFGSKLSGITGSWTSGTKFCAYWYSNGSAIAGAMGSSYRTQSSDIGQQIQYVVIGTDKSGKSVLRYSQPITITKASFTSAKLPKITGVGKVGVKLSGSVTKWNAGVNYSYQWLRNGNPIHGAQSSTYVPTADDLGTTLGFQACGSKVYFETLCLTSPGTGAVIKGVISPAPSVKISGSSTKPGAVLTGLAGNWPSGVALTIQWFSDGFPIQGETNISHTITQLDRGHALTFQVTGTSSGYSDCVKVSIAKKVP